MSYEVTATRKRPTHFDGLLGQEFVVATLKNSLKTGRIAHAYLFSGPRGVGKTSAARILARSLNCPDGPDPNGCPDFSEGEAISRGTALDVIEIDGASNTGVNDVRQIKDEVLFAPQSSRYKIYIIDEVHMLSNSAFNALLKTIEEPPPYIVFIFATTEVHKVPATIRSRCQQFNFRLVPLATIADALRDAAGDIQMQAESDALLWMAKEAGGSLRDAYTLFDQVASFSEGTIRLSDIQQKLGIVGFDELDGLACSMVAGAASDVLNRTDELLAAGISIEQFAVDLAEYFRTALLVRHGIEKTGILGRPADRISAAVIRGLTPAQLEKAVDMLFELYRNLRYSLNPRFELELTLSRLSELTHYLSPRELLDELARLRSGDQARHPQLAELSPSGTEAPSSGTESPSSGTEAPSSGADVAPPVSPDTPGGPADTPSSAAGVDADAPDTRGEEQAPDEAQPSVDETSDSPFTSEQQKAIVQAVRGRKLALGTILEKVRGWSSDNGILILSFDSAYHARAVKQDAALIRECIGEVVGETPAVKAAVIREEDESEASTEEDAPPDQVDMVRRVFRGEIIE